MLQFNRLLILLLTYKTITLATRSDLLKDLIFPHLSLDFEIPKNLFLAVNTNNLFFNVIAFFMDDVQLFYMFREKILKDL